MNVKSKAVRIIGVLAAILLSLLLVVMLIVAPLFSVTASMITPDTMMQMVQKTDIVRDFIASDEPIQGSTDENNPQAELMEAVFDSAVFRKTLDAYVTDLTAQLNGEGPTGAFTEEALKKIATEHKDELSTLVSTYVPEAADMTTAEFEEAMDEVIENYATTILEAVPSAEEVQQTLQESDLAQPLSVLASPTVPLMLYGAIALLAALVFVCLLHRFGGVLCLGIDALIASLPLAAVYAVLNSGWLLSMMDDEAGSFLQSILAILTDKLLIAVLVLAVLGILLIVGYILYNQLVFKKKFAAAPAVMPVASIIEEIAPTDMP